MNGLPSKVRSALVMGLIWGILWAIGAVLSLTIVGTLRPADIDPGEEPTVLAPIIGLVGLLCGVIFGSLLSFIERPQALLELSLRRVAMWGILVASGLVLLTGKDARMILIIGPLGAVSGLISVAIAGKWGRWLLHGVSR